MIKQTSRNIAIGWFLLLPALAGCDPSGIVGVDAKFYTLVEANGHPVALGQEQLVVGSLPYQDTSCDLLLRAGRIFTNGSDKAYDAVVLMDIRCANITAGRASAAEHGTFGIRGGTFTFEPITNEGLDLVGGTKSGDTVRLDVLVDARSLVFQDFPTFSVAKQFPLQLRFIKTAED